jgi:CTP synthase
MVTAETIYEVPLILEEFGMSNFIISRLRLNATKADLFEWRQMVARMKMPKESINIALVGKYVELEDAYYSVRESLCHAALYHDRNVNIIWVQSEDLEKGINENLLSSVHGIIVPGGFGNRGIEGMITSASFARHNNIPYLGLCLGMQVMMIEFGRYALGNKRANSTEFDCDSPCPVIDLMPEQRAVDSKGGTMRLGSYPCHLVPGTKAAEAYNQAIVYERHRHRYEFNNDFRDVFEKKGVVFSGLSPDGKLVEISELKDHRWMVACQFHPEFRSRPDRPHPLFVSFIGAAKDTLVEGMQVTLPIS